MSQKRKTIIIASVLVATLTILAVSVALYAAQPSQANGSQDALAEAAPAVKPAGGSGFTAFLPERWVQAWREFTGKVDRLKKLDETTITLRQGLAEIEMQYARLLHDYVACVESKRAGKLKREALLEGGTETARTIASLSASSRYAVLLSQPNDKLFSTALDAFNSGDFETSGKGFSHLIEKLPDGSQYRNAQTYFLGGVSLFKLGNFKRAKLYFEQALERASGDDVSYAPRALGWIALCEAKLGDKKAEAAAVRELIQKYPKSREARRLNRNA